MDKDSILHITFIVAIVILALAVGISYGHYKQNQEIAENSPSAKDITEDFLIKFEGVNLEKVLQETTKEEIAAPEAIKVPILVYHSVRPQIKGESPLVDYFDIPPELLERDLIYLKENNFSIIPFSGLVAALEGEKELPQKPVVLTFDDGWENQYTYAFPLLKKHKVTATFFIFTSAIGHKHFLSWEQIKELDRLGMTIAAHTKSHPYLFRIKDRNILTDEIIGGKKILEEGLGKPVEFFAYPFGYFNDLIISVVQEAGFKAARTSRKGTHHFKSSILTLKSIEVSDDFDNFVTNLNK